MVVMKKIHVTSHYSKKTAGVLPGEKGRLLREEILIAQPTLISIQSLFGKFEAEVGSHGMFCFLLSCQWHFGILWR